MATKVKAMKSRQLTCTVCGKPAVGVWVWEDDQLGTTGCKEHADEVKRLIEALITDGKVKGNGRFVWLTDEGSDQG